MKESIKCNLYGNILNLKLNWKYVTLVTCYMCSGNMFLYPCYAQLPQKTLALSRKVKF